MVVSHRMSPRDKDPTCQPPSVEDQEVTAALWALAGNPLFEGSWRSRGRMWPLWDSERRRNGSLVALGLRILGIHHWSLSRKMPRPDGWEGTHGTSGRFCSSTVGTGTTLHSSRNS